MIIGLISLLLIPPVGVGIIAWQIYQQYNKDKGKQLSPKSQKTTKIKKYAFIGLSVVLGIVLVMNITKSTKYIISGDMAKEMHRAEVSSERAEAAASKASQASQKAVSESKAASKSTVAESKKAEKAPELSTMQMNQILAEQLDYRKTVIDDDTGELIYGNSYDGISKVFVDANGIVKIVLDPSIVALDAVIVSWANEGKGYYDNIVEGLSYGVYEVDGEYKKVMAPDTFKYEAVSSTGTELAEWSNWNGKFKISYK